MVTDGNAGCKTEPGAMVAAIADILSSFLSKSRILLGVCPSILDLAGLLRATCSIHSTRAFWHLEHVLSSGRGTAPERLTFGIQRLCLRERTELCAYDLLKLDYAHAILPAPYSARTQMRCQTFLLFLPWRQWSCEVWGTPRTRWSPRAPRAPACVGKSVRSYAKISDQCGGDANSGAACNGRTRCRGPMSIRRLTLRRLRLKPNNVGIWSTLRKGACAESPDTLSNTGR